MEKVHILSHPLIQHKLTIMRKTDTSTAKFRALLEEISMLFAFELTRDLPLSLTEIETPLGTMRNAPILEGKKIVLVSILRAGEGMLNGMLRVLPNARVGHIGLYRDPSTKKAVQYYFKVPSDIEQRDVLLLDPMLATGNSAAHAVKQLKDAKARSIKFVSLLAAPEGIKRLHKEFSEIPIYTASVDECLNSHSYIVPGLGDAGDRLFGTK